MTADSYPLPAFPNKAKNLQFAAFASICVILMVFLGQTLEISKCQEVLESTLMMQTRPDNFMTVSEFQELNEKLFQEQMRYCACGCTGSPDLNCERQYLLKDVEKSAYVVKTKEITEYMERELVHSKKEARIACVRDDGVRLDGYCLEKMLTTKTDPASRGGPRGVVGIPFPLTNIDIPSCQLPASENLLASLHDFTVREKVNSISEFGAGVGQYGTIFRREYSDKILYRSYDFAGDVETYTQSFVSYFDMGIPLNLPVSDWVISFEAGHIIKPHKEGMMIRNLHAHNCKGIILTWGTDGQIDMIKSSNLHDESYLIDLFSQLGYDYDVKESDRFRNHWDLEVDGPWFHESLLVLRRHKPVC